MPTESNSYRRKEFGAVSDLLLQVIEKQGLPYLRMTFQHNIERSVSGVTSRRWWRHHTLLYWYVWSESLFLDSLLMQAAPNVERFHWPNVWWTLPGHWTLFSEAAGEIFIGQTGRNVKNCHVEKKNVSFPVVWLNMEIFWNIISALKSLLRFMYITSFSVCESERLIEGSC